MVLALRKRKQTGKVILRAKDMGHEFKIKDSGNRESFISGAVRDTTEGKGRYDLLPTRAIRRLAVHYENGAKKYGDDNWLKGMPMRRMAESAMRHVFKAVEGQTDEDHFIAAAWNLLGIVEYQERIKEGLLPKDLDNLPKIGGALLLGREGYCQECREKIKNGKDGEFIPLCNECCKNI